MNIFGIELISDAYPNESDYDYRRRKHEELKIWNEAIEACYKIAYDNRDYCTYSKIRKLKK